MHDGESRARGRAELHLVTERRSEVYLESMAAVSHFKFVIHL